jgi:hypothetical protein
MEGKQTYIIFEGMRNINDVPDAEIEDAIIGGENFWAYELGTNEPAVVDAFWHMARSEIKPGEMMTPKMPKYRLAEIRKTPAGDPGELNLEERAVTTPAVFNAARSVGRAVANMYQAAKQALTTQPGNTVRRYNEFTLTDAVEDEPVLAKPVVAAVEKTAAASPAGYASSAGLRRASGTYAMLIK